MRKLLACLAILVLFTGCAPSPEAIQRAIAVTETAKPTLTITPSPTSTSTPTLTLTPTSTSTPTPIPLADIDLTTLIYQEGDLPSEYIPMEKYTLTSEQYIWITNKGVNNLFQNFVKNNEDIAGTTIMLYENADEIDLTYSEILAQEKDYNPIPGLKVVIVTLAGVGEKAFYSTTDYGSLVHSSHIIFIRCHAIVSLRLGDNSDLS